MSSCSYSFDAGLIKQAEAVLETCIAHGLKLATAESCTGGMIAGLLTEIAGSSSVVERGFVTYSNEAKHELLGVPDDMLERHGAVSEPVARAMAEGALKNSLANISVSVTGVAGPGGGTKVKPVGLVYFGCAHNGLPTQTCEKQFGSISRNAIRAATLSTALDMVVKAANQENS